MTRRPRAAAELRGLKAVVVGLGRFGGGEGALRFLLEQGAEVTLTDREDAKALAPALERLKGLDFRTRLGRQDLSDCAGADLVVLNPAVRPDDPLRLALLARGIPVTSEIALFLERCEAPVLGITGSNGKSTTAALAAALLSAAGARTRFGGNIGKSLLASLPDIRPSDRVVLELSSFQTQEFARLGVGVQAAAVTNLTPNHLDYHGSFEAYAQAKRLLLDTLPEGAWGVLNAEDGTLKGWKGAWRSAWVSATAPGTPRPGAWMEGGTARVELEGESLSLALPETPRLAGPHNRMNLLTALAGVLSLYPEAGSKKEALLAAIRDFPGLPHRLEFVAEKGGVRYYNDSKATTVEAASVALAAFPPRTVHAIVGGRNKGVDLTSLAERLLERAKAIYLIGEAAGEIGIALEMLGHGPELVVAGDLETALQEAEKRAVPGDTVLLSPACASFDQFRSYEHRGEAFRELVGKLA